MVQKIEEKRKWATGASQHHNAQALYDFTARNKHELSFRKGDSLRVAPRDEQPKIHGWLLASTSNGEQIGLVPLNYLKVMRQTSFTPPRPASPTNISPISTNGTTTPANAYNTGFEAAFEG
jgi:peroxin-13